MSVKKESTPKKATKKATKKVAKKKAAKKKTVPKLYRDINRHRAKVAGITETVRRRGKEIVQGKEVEVRGDDGKLALMTPAKDHPICLKCGLSENGADNPFMDYGGAQERPIVTFVIESVSAAEDDLNDMGRGGVANFIRKAVSNAGIVDIEDVRFTSLTRCASRRGGKVNYKTKGNWCRHFAVEDIDRNRPNILIPIGTPALGAFCHKSNAQEWGGRLLTYRGWPDDWLTNKDFLKGHPAYGERPDWRIPMFPLQNPKMLYAMRNSNLLKKWGKQLKEGLRLAVEGVRALDYDRPWFRITEDPYEIIEAMQWLIDNPGTKLTYDTETTGLKQYTKAVKITLKKKEYFRKQGIVFMMFRWDQNGEPKSIAFPWDYDYLEGIEGSQRSPLLDCLDQLAPWILEAMYSSRLVGHNLGFDVLWTHATLPGADLDKLADAMYTDTLHQLFTLEQRPGSYGLETIPYAICPDFSGYEEDLTLQIATYPELMDPEKGGHYANCPKEQWATGFKTYVMGDVEVAHAAESEVDALLKETKGHTIPLSHPKKRGAFRRYKTQDRSWVHDNIMRPAGQVVAKMMGRGMYVDVEELASLEKKYPRLIVEARNGLRDSHEQVIRWCEEQEGKDPEWELDLESKDQLKEILYKVMNLPINKLTKTGVEKFGEDIEAVDPDDAYEFASCDKFTLTTLSANHPEVRSLIDYRKVHKLYSTYIKPLRNCYSPEVDKKRRTDIPHLMDDGCVHASYLLTGTRGGRLCVAGDTVLDLRVDGKQVLAEIKDLWKFAGKRVLIKTHKGRWKPVKRLFFKGYEDMYKTHLSEGDSIETTKKHRFRTPRGWEHQGDLSVGDTVSSGVSGRHRIHPGREVFCGCSSKSEAGLRCDESGMFAQNNDTQSEVLLESEGLRGTDGCAKQEAPLNETERKQERSARTLRKNTRRGPQGARRCGSSRVDNGRETRSVCLSSAEEPRTARDKGLRQGSVLGAGGTGRHGEYRGRSITEVSELRKRSSRVFSRDVQNLSEALASSVVLEGCLSWEVSVCKGEAEPAYGGDFVVNKQARNGCVTGASKQEHTPLQGVHVSREHESRFRDDRYEPSCRVGRGVPQRGEGRGAGRYSEGGRIPCTAFHDETGDIRVGVRDGRDREGAFDTITKIEYVGQKEVWDIEVEDDHSYVAQGFINHNSSSKPNMQQLPKDGLVKRVYVSRFGDQGCMFQSDLSQIELRLLAAASGDPAMTKAYWEEMDLHSMTTSRIYNIPYEHFSDGYTEWLQNNGQEKTAKELSLKRRIGKMTNFLTGYGGGALGLMNVLAAQGIYLSKEQCEDIINSFFDSYPSLKRHIAKYKRFIMDKGRAVSLFGRVRLFEEVYGENERDIAKALRSGYNHLIQSTASDMMLLCLIAIERAMRAEGLESLLISTVHDSLLIDAKRDELPVVHEICREVMDNIPEVVEALCPGLDSSWLYVVPFGGDHELGVNYLDSKLVKGDNPDWDELLSA